MEEFQIQIDDLSRGGAGVARLASGEVVFVPHTAPGDFVRVRILERKKNYSQGELIEVITPSSGRIPAPCPHFTKCGGCSWQHIPYSLQFEVKKKGLLHALSRAGVETKDIPVDELPADAPYGYRNRIQLHGNASRRELGFFRPGTREIVDLNACAIADERINRAIPALREQGFSEFQEDFKLELDVSPEGEVRAAWNLRNAAFGFRQVNDSQNSKLRAWISTHLRPAEILFDLYGGDGNLSLGVADRFEEVECADTFTPKHRAAHLPEHFRFVRMDIEKWARTALPESRKGKSTCVIADPPREGISRTLDPILQKLSHQKMESLILVGCEVDAFTRDTRGLLRAGFRLERLGVLDLFPQTPHVESLALFSGSALHSRV